MDIFGSHGLLQPLNRLLQLLFACLRAFLVLHGLSSLGLVDAFKLSVLPCDFLLLVLEGLDLLLFLMSALFELRLLCVRFVQACIEHLDLLLAFLSLGFGLQEALFNILQICRLGFCGGAVFFGRAIDLR